MNINKDLSFGSQMRLDEHAVDSIVNSLFNSIKESNKEKNEVTISIKRKISDRAITILQIKRISMDQVENLRKLLPSLIFLLVKDAKPNTIFTRYSFH